jgi:hypothetical protein
VIAPPDEKTRRWEVSAYVWQPSQIIVNEGDEVTLEFVDINGAAHPTSIAAFDQTFTVKRGQAHRVTFTADKVGIFGIICGTHRPSNTAGPLAPSKKPTLQLSSAADGFCHLRGPFSWAIWHCACARRARASPCN